MDFSKSVGTTAETRLKGRRIASGLGIGRARIVGDILENRGITHPIAAVDVDAELERIQRAFDETRVEIQDAAHRVETQFNADLADIFRAHELMLESLLASDEFSQEIRSSLMSAEAVVQRIFR